MKNTPEVPSERKALSLTGNQLTRVTGDEYLTETDPLYVSSLWSTYEEIVLFEILRIHVPEKDVVQLYYLVMSQMAMKEMKTNEG